MSKTKTIFAAAAMSLVAAPIAVADDAAPGQPKAACPMENDECPTPVAMAEPEPAPAPPPPPPQYTEPQYDTVVVETDEKPGMYSYAWSDPTLYTGIGVGIAIGGGVGGFTDSAVNNLSDSEVGGIWQFRTTFGTHTPLGVDLAYNGTAYDVQDFSGVTSDTLIGTNFEGALRWNILPHYAWNPYLFAGVGWQHYDLNDNTLTRADSGIGSEDDLAVFPMGAGIAYRDISGITAELRGTFRAADSSTFIEDINGNEVDLHTWEASAGLGYEF
jgi:hypothetical protein